MEWLVLAFSALLIVAFLLKGKVTPQDEAAYIRQERLFTPAERSFFGVLKQACGADAEVFGKVRIADVLTPAKGLGRSGWQKAFNRIAAKHFDYVVCKPDDLSTIAVVELNDSSHQKRNRADRDAFVRSACESANLTLHQFDAKHTYQVTTVRETIFPTPAVAGNPEIKHDPLPHAPAETASIGRQKKPRDGVKLNCPKCGSKLVPKVARKGKHQGQQFLACSAFPTCRYIGKAESRNLS